MNRLCQRNWGSQAKGWTFCIRDRAHDGPCCGAKGPKREDELFFEDQPEATAFLDKQREVQAKIDAKKAKSA